MIDERRTSGFDGLDLADLEDRSPPPRRSRHEIDAGATTPSREPVRGRTIRGQMNLSLKLTDIETFEALCKREGLSKAKMFVAMMNRYEARD